VEYEGYNISSVDSLILLDILQTQQEILAELKRQNAPNIEVAPESLPFDSLEVTEAIIQATEQIKLLDEQVKPVKKPVQKKPAKKKTKSKAKRSTATK